jgi:hypothetical protein
MNTETNIEKIIKSLSKENKEIAMQPTILLEEEIFEIEKKLNLLEKPYNIEKRKEIILELKEESQKYKNMEFYENKHFLTKLKNRFNDINPKKEYTKLEEEITLMKNKTEKVESEIKEYKNKIEKIEERIEKNKPIISKLDAPPKTKDSKEFIKEILNNPQIATYLTGTGYGHETQKVYYAENLEINNKEEIKNILKQTENKPHDGSHAIEKIRSEDGDIHEYRAYHVLSKQKNHTYYGIVYHDNDQYGRRHGSTQIYIRIPKSFTNYENYLKKSPEAIFKLFKEHILVDSDTQKYFREANEPEDRDFKLEKAKQIQLSNRAILDFTMRH